MVREFCLVWGQVIVSSRVLVDGRNKSLSFFFCKLSSSQVNTHPFWLFQWAIIGKVSLFGCCFFGEMLFVPTPNRPLALRGLPEEDPQTD